VNPDHRILWPHGRRTSDQVWRRIRNTLLTAAIALLSASLFIAVVSLDADRRDSRRQRDAAISETKRKDSAYDKLQDQVEKLQTKIDELRNDRSADRAELARLEAEKGALIAQIVQLGRRPVVTTTTTRPSTTTTRSPTSTTTTRPAPTTSTSTTTTTLPRPCVVRPILCP